MELRLNTNPYTLRRNLGILGISLPLILLIGNGFQLEPSISAFYYTRTTVLFTGILCAFGLFLFSYRGYDKEEEELISDNRATNLAGVLVILTALIPTTCVDQNCSMPNGHTNDIFGLIHLLCAGGFFVIMGWMSIFKFTKSTSSDPLKIRRKRLYRLCGTIVWLTIFLLLIKMLLQLKITGYDVFVGETIALAFFGAAWLIKSKTLKSIGL